MSAAGTRPPLADEKLADLLSLVRGADSVELKLTVPESDQRSAAVRTLHPDNARFQRMTDEDRVVVSEPVSDLPGVWREVPESTALIIQRGPDEQREFHPQPSAKPIATPRTAAAAAR